jgi:hypothetical protein
LIRPKKPLLLAKNSIQWVSSKSISRAKESISLETQEKMDIFQGIYSKSLMNKASVI